MTITSLQACGSCEQSATGIYNGRLGCTRCSQLGPSVAPAPAEPQ